MPSPLKNAKIGRSTTLFEPADILKLRVRFNRLIPPELETIADILESEETLRSLGLLESDPDTYDYEFSRSLEEQGQFEPAIVRPLPPDKSAWELIAGCRRATWTALRNAREERSARMAGESLPSGLQLLAIRQDVNDKQAFILALHANLKNKPLNVIEMATWAKNSERYGLSRADAARELGVTRSTLDHWLALCTAPHRMQELLISKVMPQEIALHALSAMSEAEMDRLCERFEEGATHPDPAAAKEIRKAAKADTKKAKRTSGGRLSRNPAEMRKELRASGASGTDMGKVFLSYLAGELDVEDVGWCNAGDTYEPPVPPDSDADLDKDEETNGPGAYELRDGMAVPVSARPQ